MSEKGKGVVGRLGWCTSATEVAFGRMPGKQKPFALGQVNSVYPSGPEVVLLGRILTCCLVLLLVSLQHPPQKQVPLQQTRSHPFCSGLGLVLGRPQDTPSSSSEFSHPDVAIGREPRGHFPREGSKDCGAGFQRGERLPHLGRGM